MYRKIEENIKKWLNSSTSSPLIIRDARRVEKTYLINKIGQKYFLNNFVMIDFQVDLDRLQNLFSNCTNLKELIDSISVYSKIKIKPKTTLIAFDEIQLCEKALNFLRFFKNSGYKVIATGSQLGIL